MSEITKIGLDEIGWNVTEWEPVVSGFEFTVICTKPVRLVAEQARVITAPLPVPRRQWPLRSHPPSRRLRLGQRRTINRLLVLAGLSGSWRSCSAPPPCPANSALGKGDFRRAAPPSHHPCCRRGRHSARRSSRHDVVQVGAVGDAEQRPIAVAQGLPVVPMEVVHVEEIMMGRCQTSSKIWVHLRRHAVDGQVGGGDGLLRPWPWARRRGG